MRKLVQILIPVLCIASLVGYGISSFLVERRYNNARPVIEMDTKEITLSIADGEEAFLAGVTAYDPEDGDVTASLVVESMSNMIDHSYRNATIVAFDSDNNVTKTKRKVIYADYQSPQVTLSSSLMALSSSASKMMEAVHVEDVLDGDISKQVQLITDTSITSATVGDTPAHLLISNSAGDTVDLPVTITTYSSADKQAAPEIRLTDYLIYVEQGASVVNARSYLDSITIKSRTWEWNSSSRSFSQAMNSDGTPAELSASERNLKAGDLEVLGEVDTTTPGVYELTYRLKDYSDNPAAKARLIVVVKEQ